MSAYEELIKAMVNYAKRIRHEGEYTIFEFDVEIPWQALKVIAKQHFGVELQPVSGVEITVNNGRTILKVRSDYLKTILNLDSSAR